MNFLLYFVIVMHIIVSLLPDWCRPAAAGQERGSRRCFRRPGIADGLRASRRSQPAHPAYHLVRNSLHHHFHQPDDSHGPSARRLKFRPRRHHDLGSGKVRQVASGLRFTKGRPQACLFSCAKTLEDLEDAARRPLAGSAGVTGEASCPSSGEAGVSLGVRVYDKNGMARLALQSYARRVHAVRGPRFCNQREVVWPIRVKSHT